MTYLTLAYSILHILYSSQHHNWHKAYLTQVHLTQVHDIPYPGTLHTSHSVFIPATILTHLCNSPRMTQTPSSPKPSLTHTIPPMHFMEQLTSASSCKTKTHTSTGDWRSKVPKNAHTLADWALAPSECWYGSTGVFTHTCTLQTYNPFLNEGMGQ